MFFAFLAWCCSWQLLLTLAIVIGLASRCFVVVGSGRTYVMESFGAYTRTLYSGWHFVSPLEQPVRFRWSWPNSEKNGKLTRKAHNWIPTRQSLVDPPQITVRTREGYACEIDILFYFTVDDARVAAYTHADPLRAMYTISQACLRALAAETDYETMAKKQAHFATELTTIMNEEAASYGLTVNRVVIENVTLDENIEAEMRKGQAAMKALQMRMAKAQSAHKFALMQATHAAKQQEAERARVLASATLEREVQEMRYASLRQYEIDINRVIEAEARQEVMHAISHMPCVSTLIINGLTGGGGSGGGGAANVNATDDYVMPALHVHTQAQKVIETGTHTTENAM